VNQRIDLVLSKKTFVDTFDERKTRYRKRRIRALRTTRQLEDTSVAFFEVMTQARTEITGRASYRYAGFIGRHGLLNHKTAAVVAMRWALAMAVSVIVLAVMLGKTLASTM